MPQYLKRYERPALAYAYYEGRPDNGPCILFMPGFRSDMEGTKALYLDSRCRERQQSFIRFDYRGHGRSEGSFEDGTIGLWLQDSLDIIDNVCKDKDIVVAGSSMGGWLALLVSIERPDRISGVLGIAAAPDFTREIFNDHMNASQRQEMKEKGHIDLPNAYSDEPYRITLALIEDGEKYCLLDKSIPVKVPVTLVQGMRDEDVPWTKTFRIDKCLKEVETKIILIDDADHRLSGTEDLEIIDRELRFLTHGAGQNSDENPYQKSFLVVRQNI